MSLAVRVAGEICSATLTRQDCERKEKCKHWQCWLPTVGCSLGGCGVCPSSCLSVTGKILWNLTSSFWNPNEKCDALGLRVLLTWYLNNDSWRERGMLCVEKPVLTPTAMWDILAEISYSCFMWSTCYTVTLQHVTQIWIALFGWRTRKHIKYSLLKNILITVNV